MLWDGTFLNAIIAIYITLLFFLHWCRKTLLLATGIIVAGGTAAYMQSQSRVKRPNGTGQYNGLGDDNERADMDVRNNSITKKSRQKKGLKSLQVLAAILLSHMGRMGARDLLALLATVVMHFCNSISI